LHLAAALDKSKAHETNEHVEIIRLLLDCAAEVSVVNQCQETCIHYAARQGATEQLQQIVARLSVIDAQIACNVLAQVHTRTLTSILPEPSHFYYSFLFLFHV
jgi:hypothetical protein